MDSKEIRRTIKTLEDGGWWNFVSDDMPSEDFDDMHSAIDAALTLLKETLVAQNEPLTPDEVRGMVGQPVYLPGKEDKWLLVNWIVVAAVDNGAKVYRQPPEKEETI